MNRMLVVLVVLALPCGTAAANNVFVVDSDGGPGVDFTTLQAAADAAKDGDFIILQEGSTAQALTFLPDKTLIIHGEPVLAPPGPLVAGLWIQKLTAGRRVVVRGVRLTGQTTPALLARDCEGSVLLEDVRVAAAAGTGAATVLVERSDRVVASRCVLAGGSGLHPPIGPSAAPRAALLAIDSSVALYDCQVRGGHGADAAVLPQGGGARPSQPGAPAVDLQQGSLFASSGSLTGGHGGAGRLATSGCLPPADGAAGVVLDGTLTVLGAVLAGGGPGVPGTGCPASAVPGLPVLVLKGMVTSLGETPRHMSVTSPNHWGQTATTTVTGLPGAQALLLVSYAPDPLPAPGLNGVLVGGFPLVLFHLGSLPPSGTLTFQVQIPATGFPPPFLGIEFYEQVLFAGTNGTGVLSSPSCIAVVP